MAERNAGVVNVATGEVVEVIVVEVDETDVILAWGGSAEVGFGAGHVFDLSEEAQIGRWRQPDGSYGPPPAPPDLRTDAQKIADALAAADARTSERMVTVGFTYRGIRFSSSMVSQGNWSTRLALATTRPGPISLYVNNIDDTDGMFFTHTDEVVEAAEAGVAQVGVFREVVARLKPMLRSNGASWIPTFEALVASTLAKTGEQLLAELGS